MVKLKCHPNTPSNGDFDVSVDVVLQDNGKLRMVYNVTGDVDQLKLAGNQESLRTDYLWHHTCFECFITRADQSNYIEFNLCPSTRWAAYKFSDYRKDAADLGLTSDPIVAFVREEDRIILTADISLPDGWHDGEMLMGITAILEDNQEDLSYWALKHPGEKQEFHDRNCFIHKLEATG